MDNCSCFPTSYGAKFNGREAECFTFTAIQQNLDVIKVIFQRGDVINTTKVIGGRLETPIAVVIDSVYENVVIVGGAWGEDDCGGVGYGRAYFEKETWGLDLADGCIAVSFLCGIP